MRIVHIGIVILSAVLMATCGSHYKPVEPDSVEGLGDINRDGVICSIADAVMFSNYFIRGTDAFPPGQESEALAATDVNRDGVFPSVADLVYCIRYIIGDVQPDDTPNVRPVRVWYTYSNGVIEVSYVMGAALFVFDGNVEVELLAGNMELKYEFDGQVTRALVWSLDGNTFVGDVVRGENMISLEFGSADGAPVLTSWLPEKDELFQNSPNPFHEWTRINFAIAREQHGSLTVCNSVGREIYEESKLYQRGYHSVSIRGEGLPSGFYYYTLTTEDFSDTKKMWLLR